MKGVKRMQTLPVIKETSHGDEKYSTRNGVVTVTGTEHAWSCGVTTLLSVH